EQTTGHRNRAIAYMMLNTAMIVGEPEEVLGLYFRQCSVAVTCKDLALMAATLANDGTHPITGDSILSSQTVRDVLTVMNSCGMYNYAGQWSYQVGVPAKRGGSGCLLAVMPGQIGLTIPRRLIRKVIASGELRSAKRSPASSICTPSITAPM